MGDGNEQHSTWVRKKRTRTLDSKPRTPNPKIPKAIPTTRLQDPTSASWEYLYFIGTLTLCSKSLGLASQFSHLWSPHLSCSSYNIKSICFIRPPGVVVISICLFEGEYFQMWEKFQYRGLEFFVYLRFCLVNDDCDGNGLRSTSKISYHFGATLHIRRFISAENVERGRDVGTSPQKDGGASGHVYDGDLVVFLDCRRFDPVVLEQFIPPIRLSGGRPGKRPWHETKHWRPFWRD